jgi:hypothetical protein
MQKPRAIAFGIGGVLLLTLAAGIYQSYSRNNRKVVIGSRDEVNYIGAATKGDAQRLGQALAAAGFFRDEGVNILLSKGPAGFTVSFVVKESAWNHPDTIASYEVIGRRIAPALGGFPITLRLLDSANHLKKLTIGRVAIGTRDEVYYFGSATAEDAQSLGQSLKSIGFFTDAGATAAISKGDETAIWFVTNEGYWDNPNAVAAFESVARQAAASVGGLPVQVRLLNAQMEVKKLLAVQ